MVVCRHFLQGNCRFGNSCRNEHTSTYYETDEYYNASQDDQYQSKYHGDRYHYVKPATPSTQQEITPSKISQDTVKQLFDVVAQDTIIAVNGGQWPFSVYAPVKGLQAITGFNDISPEELRWLMYNAQQSGNVDEYKRYFQELLHAEHIKRTLISIPSAEAYTACQSIYRKDDIESASPFPSGEFQPSQPALGRSAAEKHSASIFGGSSSPTPFAANTNTSSIFGGNSLSPPTTSLFGAENFSSNVFGGGKSPSIFGGGSSVQPTANVFGSAPSGLFSAAAAAVSQQTSGGFFGAAPSPIQPPSGLFAAAAASNQRTFGDSSAAVPSGFFGGSSAVQPNAFGSVSHTASIFGGQHTTAPTQPFGGFQSSNEQFKTPGLHAGSFGHSSEVSDSVYSLMVEISKEAKAAFEAKTFTIGRVPTRPPPRELCV